MKLLGIIVAILGIVFLVIAVVYFFTPAHNLPLFFPGFDPLSTKTHFKHGIGAIGLALACFAFAWFQTGKKSSK